jgi:hypothetical protein
MQHKDELRIFSATSFMGHGLELYSNRHNKPLKNPTKSKFTPC